MKTAYFAGIWIFKRNKIGPGLRLVTVWLITLGTAISAVWILTANAFMQHPVGYELADDGSKVALASFGDLVTNPYLFRMFFHNHAAALLIGSFIVLGVSAHRMKDGPKPALRKSVDAALVVGLVAALSLPALGDSYGKYVASVQPLKAALILGQLKADGKGSLAPDATSAASLPVDLASLPELPDAGLVRGAFLAMVVLGLLFVLYLLLLTVRRRLLWESRFFRGLSLWAIPAGYVAVICGWIVAEAGRVPWIVYGLMSIRDAASSVPVASVAFSLFLMVALYALLFAIALKLIVRAVRRGPDTQEAPHAAA